LHDEIYTGIRNVVLDSDEKIAQFYETMQVSENLYTNEYVIIRDKENKAIDKFRWNGQELVKLKYKIVNNQFIGKVKPLNVEQECFMDLCDNNRITIKSGIGVPGGGKTFIPISVGINKVLNGEFSKFVFIKNNVDSSYKDIGSLPGTLEEKLAVWEYSLLDSVGDKIIIDKFKNENKIEVVHLGHTPGRTFNSCFILVDESSWLSKKHVYNLTTRVGHDSVCVFAGDTFQNYTPKYANGNNGIKFLHDKSKGNKLFGCVKMVISERSETAQIFGDLLFESLLDIKI
jgi:predicted ribonuclease YlaK